MAGRAAAVYPELLPALPCASCWKSYISIMLAHPLNQIRRETYPANRIQTGESLIQVPFLTTSSKVTILNIHRSSGGATDTIAALI